MDSAAKIYVAGHRGLAGGAIVRALQKQGFHNLLLKTHAEVELTSQAAVESFFAAEKPDYVFLAAAKVGGIQANNVYPAEFIRDTLATQTNVIHGAWLHGVKSSRFWTAPAFIPSWHRSRCRRRAC